MDSGQVELLIGKIAFLYSKASLEMADLVRDFVRDCQAGKDVMFPPVKKDAGRPDAGTQFDPPFDERDRHREPETGLAASPQEQTSVSVGVKVDALTAARLKARYAFWLKKVADGTGGESVEALKKFDEAALECERAGIILSRQTPSPQSGSKTPQGAQGASLVPPVPQPARKPAKKAVKKAVIPVKRKKAKK